MKINHAWKQSPTKPPKQPKYVPVEYHEACLKAMQRNSYDFAVQLGTELAALAVHEAFGIGPERMKRFLSAMGHELDWFSTSVNEEYNAETVGMSAKQREKSRPDLAYTMEKLDARLKEVIPDIEPFQRRYGRFGGRVSFADKEQSDRRVKETLRKLKEDKNE